MMKFVLYGVRCYSKFYIYFSERGYILKYLPLVGISSVAFQEPSFLITDQCEDINLQEIMH